MNIVRSTVILFLVCLLQHGNSQQWLQTPLSERDKGLPFFNNGGDLENVQVFTMQEISLRNKDLTTLKLPTPDGEIQDVELVEDPLFAPGLQAQFPNIKSYIIVGEGVSGRLAWNNGQLDGMFKYNQQWVGIERLQSDKYVVYYEEDGYAIEQNKSLVLGNCLTGDIPGMENTVPKMQPDLRSASLSDTKIYDLAVSTTSTYSARYGGNLESVLAQINIVFNRVNVVFQRELGLKFRIIENVPDLIYLTKASDPYLEGNNNAMLNQAGTQFNKVVGFSNYDIGHLLATNCGLGTAGVSSGIGTVCNQAKGQALSCDLTQNISDYVRVLTHELGHQLGARHSWSNCPGVNEVQRASSSAVEPGSGSTIMSYISSCGEENLKVINGPLYFHGNSIQEMNNYMTNGVGAQCVSIENSINHHPEILSMPANGLVVPIKTPFFLEGNAVDADGDDLLYNWEQVDLGPIAILGSPIQSGPMFRSFPPDNSNRRYFPAKEVVLANENSVEEVLPTYSRKMNFLLSVRDFDDASGGMASESYQLSSTEQAGPFLVMFPNSVEDDIYTGGFTSISWDVANTDRAPVNASFVDIMLSVDGGKTYAYTLAEKTENDGEASVQLPNVETDAARIMVVANDHIFYDVSDENLIIKLPSEPTYGLNVLAGRQTVCLPDTPTVEIQSFSVLGFADSIEYSIESPYAGVEINLPFVKGAVGEPLAIEFVIDPAISSDTLVFELVSKSASLDTFKREIKLIIVNNNFSGVTAIYPNNSDKEIELTPDFQWTTSVNADYYTLEVSKSGSFQASDLTYSETNISGGKFVSAISLEGGEVYFWRIRSHNLCGQDEESLRVYGFQTAEFNCETYTSNDLPRGIGGSSPGSIESEITVASQFVLADVNVKNIKGYHESVDQLKFSLEKEDTEVVLYNGECGVKTFDFSISFDDDVLTATDCRLSSGDVVRPLERLSDFNGMSAQGKWKFIMADSVIGSGGLLNEWSIEVCGSIGSTELSVQTDSLVLGPLATASLTSGEILLDDYNDLLFELIELPERGQLKMNGQVMASGSKWTGQDLQNGRIVYTSTENQKGLDGFRISILSNDKTWSGLIDVPVVIDPRVANEAKVDYANLNVYPNPVANMVTVENIGGLSWKKCEVYDVQGRMMYQQVLNVYQTELQIPTHSWSPGMYIMVVRTEDNVIHSLKMQKI